MKKKATPKSDDTVFTAAILVWDLPTRLFHWLLVVLIGISFVTGKIGGNAMQYHEWCGIAILALLFYRVIWGFVGSQTSRFSNFVKGPAEVARYAMDLIRGNSSPYLGHNPLGGWSILAMLMVLFIQAATGLFANDDIITEGPLYLWVSKPTSDWLTRIHRSNQNLILVLGAIHIFAVLFHLFAKHENLIKPMVTGTKHWSGNDAAPKTAPPWPAAVIAVLTGCLIYFIVY